MTDIAPHDWFRPRLSALVADAAKAGFATDVAVAVITDLINGPPFSVGAPAGDEAWNQDIGEPIGAVNQTIDQDEVGLRGDPPIGQAGSLVHGHGHRDFVPRGTGTL